MGKRISGKNMTFTLEPSGLEIVAEEVSLTIDDSGIPAMDGGRPSGHLDGEVKASGDISVDLENFALLNQAAEEAGSFSQLPEQDFLFYGEADGFEEKVAAFGNKLKIAEAVNYKPSGGEKLLRKIPYNVGGKDFVKINDVPYLPEPE